MTASFGVSPDNEWRERRDRRWAVFATIIGCIVAVGWSAYDTLTNKDIPANLAQNQIAYVAGTVFGDALLISIVIFIVIYFLFLRRHVEGMGFAVFLSLYCSVIAVTGGGLALLKNYGDQKWAEARTQQHIALSDMRTAVSNFLANPRGAVDTRVLARGDAGEAERIFKQALVESAQASRDYQTGLAQLGFPTFLQPAELVTSRERTSAIAKLEKARGLAAGLAAKVSGTIASERSAIKKSHMSDQYKAGVLTGFNRSAEEEQHSATAVINSQDAVFEELENGVKLLSHTKGRWIVRGKAIAFTDLGDLPAYNAHIARLRALQQQAQESSALERGRVTNFSNANLQSN